MQPTDKQPVEKKIELLTSRVDDVYHILDRLHQHLVPENARQEVATKTFPKSTSKNLPIG
jgi:hypothetical protein